MAAPGREGRHTMELSGAEWRLILERRAEDLFARAAAPDASTKLKAAATEVRSYLEAHGIECPPPTVNETGLDPADGRPADSQGADPARWRAVVAVLLDPWPTPAARAELAREVAAEARAALADPVSLAGLHSASELISLATDILEASTPSEERSQP